MCEFKEAIRKHRDGATLDLFVTPGAKCSVFPAGYDKWRKRMEAEVCSEAKEDKANKEIVGKLAECFNKPVKDVLIISGEKSREKTLLVKGASVDDVIKILRGSLNGS
jgi:uncharacterized protein (TIGR00251 family)